jgi:hypothetical protein
MGSDGRSGYTMAGTATPCAASEPMRQPHFHMLIDFIRTGPVQP